jgi:hypothetical protein
MSRIPLSERLTAMAFVDQLRHEQKQVQEHLDLPRRRVEIAERIRAYYVSNDIAFDDALIDQGVRQFFARRLTFEVPPLKGFDAWLVKTLSDRPVVPGDASTLHTGRWLLIVVLMLAAIGLTEHFNTSGVAETTVRDASKETLDRYKGNIELNKTLEKWRALLATLLRSNAEQPDANVTRLLKRVQQVLPVDDVANLDMDEPITADNAPAFIRQSATLKAVQDAVFNVLPQVRVDLTSASGILWMRQGIREMRQDPKAAATLAQSDDLQQRLTLLEQQLARMDNEKDYQDAFFAYRNLYRDVINASAGAPVQTP